MQSKFFLLKFNFGFDDIKKYLTFMQRIGCDWIVGSNAIEDQCGVCGGNGDTCVTIRDEFTKKINMTDGYYEIALIPSGSRHIKVEEMAPSKNYIGVGKADSKEFYLNGDRLIAMPGEYEIAGALGLYERDQEMEKLVIPGPVKDDVALYVNRNLVLNCQFS
jgi:hypothetical protein